jgi:hypothetical protein
MSDRILERAFELARSGQCSHLSEIHYQLKLEGFTQIQAHLDGPTIKNQLKKLMAAANRRPGDSHE